MGPLHRAVSSQPPPGFEDWLRHSAFLASTATKVAYYLLIRFCLGLFGLVFVFETVGIDTLLMPLSVLAMFVGSIAAASRSPFHGGWSGR